MAEHVMDKQITVRVDPLVLLRDAQIDRQMPGGKTIPRRFQQFVFQINARGVYV